MKNSSAARGVQFLAIVIIALFSTVHVRAESAAGIVRTDIEPDGSTLLGLPFHPFNDGRLDDVLHGWFLGGGDWLDADAASLWFADSQSWSNAWFGSDGAWHGLEDFSSSPQAMRFGCIIGRELR